MRKGYFAGIVFLLLSVAVSCIKGEKANIEVDIERVSFANEEGILNVAYLPQGIDIYVDAARINPSNLTLSFVLSEGASVRPDPATVSDYSGGRSFTVTSEDAQWEKTWTVRVITADMPVVFNFEHWYQPDGKRYMLPCEYIGDAGQPMQLNIWACGNEAYAYAAGKKDYTAYPTQPSASSEAATGEHALKLVTMSTGDLYKPIAAGNVFIGEFDPKEYEPRDGTHFGLPFRRKPLRFTGKYRYISGGETYISKEQDRCKIQAVLYRTDEQVKYLTGFTIADSPYVIARAELPESSSSSTSGEGYASFDVEFRYTGELDKAVLDKGGYNLAIVLSSSRNGDTYDGAIGSKLFVDDLEIHCDTNF